MRLPQTVSELVYRTRIIRKLTVKHGEVNMRAAGRLAKGRNNVPRLQSLAQKPSSIHTLLLEAVPSRAR
jgi:hypothetical protein